MHGSQSLRAVLPVLHHSFPQIWFAQTDGERACRSASVEATSCGVGPPHAFWVKIGYIDQDPADSEVKRHSMAASQPVYKLCCAACVRSWAQSCRPRVWLS